MDTSLISPWLPSIISIVVVIIGGFIAYSSTIRIEERKREYELKKEVYFDLLDAINEYKSKIYDLDQLCLATPFNERTAIQETLISHRMKMEICANEEVFRHFSDVLFKIAIEKDEECLNTIHKKLIPAIRNDLLKSKKTWLKFWK